MKKILSPYGILNSIFEIPLEDLQQKNIRYLLMDMDNTLVSLAENKVFKESFSFIAECKEKGIEVIIVSNNFIWKVLPHARKLSLRYFSFSWKPLPFVYRKFMKKNKVSNNQIMAVGDQLFTDVLGAQSQGIPCFFLKNVKNKDRLLTKLFRILERRILNEQ